MSLLFYREKARSKNTKGHVDIRGTPYVFSVSRQLVDISIQYAHGEGEKGIIYMVLCTYYHSKNRKRNRNLKILRVIYSTSISSRHRIAMENPRVM